MNEHALNRLLTLSLQTVGILCLSILNPGASISAQSADRDDRSVILKITTQITDEFSKAEKKEKSAIETAARERATAKANLEKTNAEVTEATEKLRKSEDKFKELREKYDSMVANKAKKKELEAAEKEVNAAGKERDEAKEKLYYLERNQSSYSNKFTEAEAELQEMTSVFAKGISERAALKAELELSISKWQANPTPENLIALSDQIAAISCEQNIYAHPSWKTTPNYGANLYYQSIGERKRGGRITPINNPTQTEQPICLGIYYVWAERGGKVTSNKDKTFVVFLGIPDVTVVEDR